MNAKQFYENVLNQATEVIDHVSPDDYNKPTPDAEWDVHDLTNHTLSELCWTADIVEGRTIAEVGDKYDGDLVGDGSRLPAMWHTAADAAHVAIATADLHDLAHVSYDDITVEEYLLQAGTDQLIHAWDVAQAINLPLTFDRALAETAYQYLLPQKDILYQTGLFDRPVPVPKDAPIQTRLLALTGRKA